MGYLGLGDVSSDKFNSTKYPGICKPSDTATLATFKRLQTQMNRVASAKGIATIAPDGDIGPAAVGLFGKLQAHLGTYAAGEGDVGPAMKIAAAGGSCIALASVADVVANVADSYADSLGASANPPAPPVTKPPILVSQTGIEKPAPVGAGLLSSFESLPTTYKVVGLGILGGIGYFAYKDMKGLRRGRGRSRRR